MNRIAGRIWTILTLVLVTVALSAAVDRAEAEELFRQANALYRQANGLSAQDPPAAMEHYRQAAMHYERIIREGGIQNGSLYYNLGNAYYRAGDLGRSILNYRRAWLLMPGDPDLAQNLETVRQRRTDHIVEAERRKVLKTLFFFHYDLSQGTRKALFAGFFLLFWASAALLLFSRRTSLKWLLAVSGIVTALLLGSLAVDQATILWDRSGVVTANEIVARKGDGETYQPSFQEPLHSGTEFEILEARQGWWRIRLADSRECWIPESAGTRVRQT